MLAQHTVHDTSVSRQTVVVLDHVCVPVTVCCLESTVQTVGHGLIRSEDTEVLVFFIQTENITYISAQLDHILRFCLSGLYLDSVITEIRQTQVFQKQTAVCVRIGAHTRISLWSQLCNLRFQTAVLIKQLFRTVAFQPLFQLLKMYRFFHGHRDLMCTEGSFDLLSVYYLRASPSLRCAQNDHRPYRSFRIVVFSCVFLDCFDLFDHGIHRLSHLAVHGHRIIAFYEVRFPSTSLEEGFHFLMRNT